MLTPTMPITSAELLAAASHLTFRARKRDRSGSTLGVLVDATGAEQHLVIAPGGDDRSWALASALTPGTKSFLLYESAANVLRGGNLGDDGSITYQGGSYTIESADDGTNRTAKVSGRG